MSKVYILGIDDRGGTQYYAFRSRAGARAKLLDYVEANWDDPNLGLDPAMPADHDEAIEFYFEVARDKLNESYILIEEPLND